MNKMFLFLLLSAFAIFAGCAKEEEQAAARSNDYVIVANQDERNRLKYSFKVMHNGEELTTKNAVFSWNFGDAAGSSTLSNPTYEYAEESERKVSVSLLIRDGDAGRVSGNASADISLLVGSSPDVYRAVINAYPGEGNDLLKYRLVSSALPSDVNGWENLLYYWRITDPDCENSQCRYPTSDSEHITSNTLDKHTFHRYGYGYDIDLYITNAGSSFDMNTASPSTTMRLTTALPDFTVQCGILTEKSITCTPTISTTNADFLSKVEYTWTFYSYNDAGVPVKEGTETTTGNNRGGSIDYTFAGENENGGLKMIEVTATHPTHMNGTVRATTDVALNTSGILGAVSCERPTNTWGEYTDSTKLKYRCSVEGYYNDSEHLGTPLALSEYKWSIKIDNESGAAFSGNGEYSISGTADKDTPINEVLLKKIECGGELGNRCISTIEFDAKRYGETYYITVSGKKASSSTQINGTATTITIDKPKLVSIDRTANETNARISTFTPVFDTTLPDSMKLKYYWTIKGSEQQNDTSNVWYETVSGVNCNGSQAIEANGKHEIANHTFSKNGFYNITLRIVSNMYTDGRSDTTETPIELVTTTSNTLGPLEINQEVTGSYFRVVPNYTTNEYRFYTDYDLRVNGVVQPACYIYKIYGPNYNNPRNVHSNSGPEQKVILKNGKEYTTLKPVNPETTPANNAKLLFGATYGVQLTICAEAFFDKNARACNRQGTHGAQAGVTYRDINLNGASSIQAGSVTTGTLNWILQKPNANMVQKTWYHKEYLTATTTVNGNKVPIDLSIFKCTWDFSRAAGGNTRITLNPPFPTDQNAVSNTLNNTSCANTIWLYSYQKGFQDNQRQEATLRVYGPEYNSTQSKRINYKTFDASFLFKDSGSGNNSYNQDNTAEDTYYNH